MERRKEGLNMAARAATNKDAILTTAQLAAELAITEAEALALMKDKGFPSTLIPGTKEGYCVHRTFLENWIKEKARKIEGISMFSLENFIGFGNAGKK